MRTGISTFSFVGSDKNAGKTTALNFVYKKMHAEGVQNLIVSSIGINGESYDSLEVHPKPEITINAGDFFITEVHHLKGSTGLYEIKHLYSPPHFRKNFVLGKTLVNLPLILEGPNDKAGLQMIKNNLKTRFKNATIKRTENPRALMQVEDNLSPDVLTIGFARRFATYKRAHLLFRDLNRLAAIVNNPDMPVQFIFAGKAHPKDKAGQDLIKMVVDISLRMHYQTPSLLLSHYLLVL